MSWEARGSGAERTCGWSSPEGPSASLRTLRAVAGRCVYRQHDARRTGGAPQMLGLFLPPLSSGLVTGTVIRCFDSGFTPESSGCPTQAKGF